MQLEPRVGILQTGPTLINGKSLFARVQQFANQVYGPLFSTGLAALQLRRSSLLGHNAIMVCTELFMRHCGLPRMKGPGISAARFSVTTLSKRFHGARRV